MAGPAKKRFAAKDTAALVTSWLRTTENDRPYIYDQREQQRRKQQQSAEQTQGEPTNSAPALIAAPTPIPSRIATQPAIDPSVVDAVFRLQTPPEEAYNRRHNMITLQFKWAIEIVGEQNFECNFRDPRKVLGRSTPLYNQGIMAGLPLKILAWLAGTPGTEELVLPIEIFDAKSNGR
ncbi:hypothetical protein K505DRAFT_387124 [Melanomma pulvis-pyrius CBS 109.77]|uniref:Uncharacterized protein n=1 Tax=Melanomma pulvis-pyrius CBS 109.77 TaxID=1314802 RepID=A0A6A6X8B4_9PLEO|nr:hypothetical protein K505DRAFT_387124 [Melanomma pulvis-pyrius CBS 109.77]